MCGIPEFLNTVVPRPRGFTRPDHRRDPHRLGSSAHARVHRSRGAKSRLACRFLRARAGSPLFDEAALHAIRVSPRTRGFTAHLSFVEPGSLGFSAHAQVHRGRRLRWVVAGRFFRARAGLHGWQVRVVRDCAGHPTKGINRFLEEVLPRTRGFTVSRALSRSKYDGSSAHARVHRSMRTSPTVRQWFFRARAGSPWSSPFEVPLTMVLLRTRGFTGQRDGMVRALRGSSAHARVHRRCGMSSCSSSRFFRARAGSPGLSYADACKLMVLPRTRGFTELLPGP